MISMKNNYLVASICLQCGRPGFDPGSGRSPGEENGNPLQYSCLENPMDGGAWWATVPGVAKSRTRLSDFTFTFLLWRLKAGGEGDAEDEMVGWYHQLNGHEFEQAPGDGEGQGSLACCSPWGYKESDTTERLNWTTIKLRISVLRGMPPINSIKNYELIRKMKTQKNKWDVQQKIGQRILTKKSPNKKPYELRRI